MNFEFNQRDKRRTGLRLGTRGSLPPTIGIMDPWWIDLLGPQPEAAKRKPREEPEEEEEE
jgi:hypothetical protein